QAKDCREDCTRCHGRHHVALCERNDANQGRTFERPLRAQVNTLSTPSSPTPSVSLTRLWIGSTTLRHPSTKETVHVDFILDCGAQPTIISEDIVSHLSLP